ncbi:hypothetical protein, partial [Gilliamella apis]|uniref:hypothetical protein n=1 Tax=Gilliamella apis TaxID=1970738 RepID=UPI000B6C9691
SSDNPGEIARPSLPQVFELVGRDSSGNAVVKYGFVLKQWFVNRGSYTRTNSSMEAWCSRIGYRVPNVRDLTNASCRAYNYNPEGSCNGLVEATPTSPDYKMRRHIGAGFFSEWGNMNDYPEANFYGLYYWTNDKANSSDRNFFDVHLDWGYVHSIGESANLFGVCVYP